MLAPCEYSNLSGISSAEAKNISDLKYVKNAMIQLMLSYSTHEWTIWPGLEYSIFNNAAAIFVGLCISWKLICQTSHTAWIFCASVLRGWVSNAPPSHVRSLKCCVLYNIYTHCNSKMKTYVCQVKNSYCHLWASEWPAQVSRKLQVRLGTNL